MKTFLICIVLISASLFSKAQLANTKWTGTMMVPDERQVVLSFKKDSLFIMIDDQAVETMSYSVKDSLINAKKIEGQSPCSDDAFTLKFVIKGDKLFIKDIDDPCDLRMHAWVDAPFTKEK